MPHPLSILLFLSLIAGTLRANPALHLDLVLTLEGAVLREKGPRNNIVGPRDLLLSVICEQGTWQNETVGFVVDLNRGYQRGTVAAKMEGGAIELAVEITIGDDWTVQGGPGKYRLRLHREGERYKGTYSGTFNDKPVSGAVHAWAIRPVPLPQAPLGHPRLAFGPADLPALRAKANTPQGQRIVQRLRGLLANWTPDQSASSAAAGYALLHTLSGEARDAAAARAMAKYSVENELYHQNWITLGAHLRHLALAYDQCFEAWDEPFRVQVAILLRRWGSDMMDFHDRNNAGLKSDPASAWQAHARSSALLANLAVLGDSMRRSDGELPEFRTIEPLAGYEPGRGVPVVAFINNQTFDQWLFAGPFPPIDQEPFAAGRERSMGDYLGSLGGPERALPAIGTQIAWSGITRTFQRLPAMYARPEERGNIFVDVYNASGQQDDTTWYYFTVIHNEKERYLGVNIHQRNSLVWLGGQRLSHNQMICMKPGYIPLLIQVSAGRGRHWDTGVIGTRFWEVEKDHAIGGMQWRRDVELRGHLETDPGIQRNARVGKLLVGRFMHEHGRDAEGVKAADLAAGIEPVMQYLLAWRNMSGGDPWHPDLPTLATDGIKRLAGGDDPAAFDHPHEAIYRLVFGGK